MRILYIEGDLKEGVREASTLVKKQSPRSQQVSQEEESKKPAG